MGIFKSKKKKELEKRMLIRRSQASLRKYIKDLENKQEKHIKKAKEAKLTGNNLELKLAITSLKTTIGMLKVAKKSQMVMEHANELKDMSKLTSSFLESMSVLSKDMATMTKSQDFIKVQSQFEAAMGKVAMNTEELELFSEMSADSFDGMIADTDISDDEINSLIDLTSAEDDRVSDKESRKIDEEIDSKLDELEKLRSN